GPVAESLEWAATASRGEFVLVIGGAPPPPPAAEQEMAAALQHELAAGAPVKAAAATVARRYGVSRRDTYALALRVRPPGR
ncbi:MAG: hypothetical protein QOJ19_1874, partial [Acidimicrobiia bacterium]|nr:hypothetical protein [Acidimicrobiia bacterium]